MRQEEMHDIAAQQQRQQDQLEADAGFDYLRYSHFRACETDITQNVTTLHMIELPCGINS
jgi:hypothetical protein